MTIELSVGEKQVLTSLLSRGFRWIARDPDKRVWAFESEPVLDEVDGYWKSVSRFFDTELLAGSEYSPDWFSWVVEEEPADIEKLINYKTIKASGITTPQEPRDRMQLHKEICNKLHEVYVAKNADYGNSFVTVREEVDRAIIVRLMDKMERLKTLTRKGYDAKVEESIEDTLMDMSNYAIMEILEMRLTKEKEGDNI